MFETPPAPAAGAGRVGSIEARIFVRKLPQDGHSCYARRTMRLAGEYANANGNEPMRGRRSIASLRPGHRKKIVYCTTSHITTPIQNVFFHRVFC